MSIKNLKEKEKIFFFFKALGASRLRFLLKQKNTVFFWNSEPSNTLTFRPSASLKRLSTSERLAVITTSFSPVKYVFNFFLIILGATV